MDILSLSKASQVLRQIKGLDNNTVAPLAEDRFPTVDARLDWLEGQAAKVKVANSKQLDLSQGAFTNTELVNGKIQLKNLGSTIQKGTINHALGATGIVATTMNASTLGAGNPVNNLNNIFDGNPSTYASSSASNSNMIKSLVFTISQKVNPYLIKITEDGTSKATMNGIQFYGYNSVTSSWDLLTPVAQNFTIGSFETLSFNVSTNQLYDQYKMVTTGTSNNSGSEIRINEIEIYAMEGSQYVTSGTWESPVIDNGDGWLDTTAIDIIKNSTATGTNVKLEICSSTDGTTFTGYVLFDPANVPQTRYVKIRATLLAPEGVATSKTLNFNQGDTQNTMTLNSNVLADGSLHLQTNYSLPVKDEGVCGSGEMYSVTLDKTQFKSIEKVVMS